MGSLQYRQSRQLDASIVPVHVGAEQRLVIRRLLVMRQATAFRKGATCPQAEAHAAMSAVAW